jgi:hypothetical protein
VRIYTRPAELTSIVMARVPAILGISRASTFLLLHFSRKDLKGEVAGGWGGGTSLR